MSKDRDSMVFTPGATQKGDSAPRRKAVEERKLARAKRKKSTIVSKLRKARIIRGVQSARAIKASGLGRKVAAKAGSRLAGPVGIALLAMDVVNAVGSVSRRAEGGISGRLLEAMDQNTIYGQTDEIATGTARAREGIEGNEDLLKIIGIQDRVNSQVGQLGAWFKEREIARAIGSDLIEREPSFDHLESIADKAIAGSMNALKVGADEAINAIRSFAGKGPLVR